MRRSDSLVRWPVAIGLALLAMSPTIACGASLAAASVALTILGNPQPALDWAGQKCNQDDIPDAGIRAFHTTSSGVVAIASHYETRLMTGPSLMKLRKDCAISLSSARDPDPSAFNDKTWILATWTDDGVHVMGIGHNEYHGENHPGHCTAGAPMCRYGGLLFLKSSDGGRHFERPHVAPLAAVSARQSPDLGNAGFFSPSNIFERDGVKYAFVRSSGGGTQPKATCLMRSSKPLDPKSWQIFDGKSFRPSEFDPYHDDPQSDVVCAQIPGLNGMVWSVLKYRPSGELVSLLTVVDPITKGTRLAISVSQDPLSWPRPTVIDENLVSSFGTCAGDAVYWYPSLIDPTSNSKNFDDTGGDPVLFLTRLQLSGCRSTMTRELYYVKTKLTMP